MITNRKHYIPLNFNKSMDTSILEDLGLTGAEIKIFLTLLELGTSTAGAVVEKSGLQNAVVHRGFHSLINKGLISYILEGKIKNYQAVKPKALLNYIDEKREKLKKILPELEARQKEAKERPQASLFQGTRGVKELLNYLIETKSEDYSSYGGPKKANDLLGEHFWESFHNKRIKNKIDAKMLFHRSLKEWGDYLNKKKLTKLKFTNHEFEALTETIICGNKVGIIIYLDKPYGFLIEERLAAESYKKFFELLWRNS